MASHDENKSAFFSSVFFTPSEGNGFIPLGLPDQSRRCDSCREILRMRFGEHTQTRLVTDLRQSATQSNCDFCRILLRGLDEYLPQLSPPGFIEIDTTWNISCQGFHGRPLDLPYYEQLFHPSPREVFQVEFFVPESPLLQDGQLFTGLHSLSNESLSFVHNRMDQCLSTHPDCGGRKEHILPTRILDIGLETTDQVKLVRIPGKASVYACLSHCWGPSRSITTTTKNIHLHEENVLWPSLPKTYQEAITFVRLLGIRYLWIDALCILQDSEEDWALESSRMASIYENSFITLAGTRSPDHHSGCSSHLSGQYQAKKIGFAEDRQTSESWPVFVRQRLPHPTVFLHSDWCKGYQNMDKLANPLLTRGWCYQERILSPRVLHFLQNELLWECRATTRCECEAIPLRAFAGGNGPALGLIKSKEDCKICQSHRHWKSIVQGYTALKLTFEKDKLPALSGLASKMQQFREDRYLAGLWERTLSYELLWHVDGKPSPRSFTSNTPSWSWASTSNSTVTWFGDAHHSEDSEHGANDLLIKVLQVDVVPASLNLCGEVKSGTLLLSGFLSRTALRWEYDESRGNIAHFDPIRIDEYCADLTPYEFCPDYALRHPDQHEIPNGAPLYFLHMTSTRSLVGKWTWHCLLLRLRNEQAQIYERIGFVTFKPSTYQLGTPEERWDLQKQTITIV